MHFSFFFHPWYQWHCCHFSVPSGVASGMATTWDGVCCPQQRMETLLEGSRLTPISAPARSSLMLQGPSGLTHSPVFDRNCSGLCAGLGWVFPQHLQHHARGKHLLDIQEEAAPWKESLLQSIPTTVHLQAWINLLKPKENQEMLGRPAVESLRVR